MNNNGKNQDQLTKIFSEYFSDDNFKCQLWAAFSHKNDKTTAYIFMTSSPLTSYSPEDAIVIRLSLLQAESLAAALEHASRDPEAFGKGYQAAQSIDQSKSLTIKAGRPQGTDDYMIVMFFIDGEEEHVITLSHFEALGIAELLRAAVQGVLGQQCIMAGARGTECGSSRQPRCTNASPVHKKPTKTKDPLDSMIFNN